MTANELKKLDKKISAINQPFGSGFLFLQKIFQEAACRSGSAPQEVLLEYLHWKTGHQYHKAILNRYDSKKIDQDDFK